jgi:hypothetical protein
MKLVACTAHVDPTKLHFLQRQLQSLKDLGICVHAHVITNLQNEADLNRIRGHFPAQTELFTATVYNEGCHLLKSAWLLTWVHKKIMLERFQDESYTHFLNIEDDMDFTKSNLDYWLKYRPVLKSTGLFPSFIRIEQDHFTHEFYHADSLEGDSFELDALPKVKISEDYAFVNLPRPYQAMFLYDRELMEEHIQSDTFHLEKHIPDWEERIKFVEWPVGLTERACFAISEQNVPSQFFSRNCVPVYLKYGLIDPCAFVHHLPDKYINDKKSKLAKTRIVDLFKTNRGKTRSVSSTHLESEQLPSAKVSNKWSSYLAFYDELFEKMREKPVRMLEIGIQNGGSLEVWSRYFRNAELIVGCDIDGRCERLAYGDERVTVHIGDVNSPETFARLAAAAPFDIVIDDGSHHSTDIIVAFVNYFPLLRPGGVFVVEDTHAIYSQIGSMEMTDQSAFGFFKALTETLNYQFWSNLAAPDVPLKRFFTGDVPQTLTEGWIESIEFRNSIITIKKSQTPTHEKVGFMCVTGHVADVDPTPLRIKQARQQAATAGGLSD